MKVLVLVAVLLCILNSAIFQPIENPSEELKEFLNNFTIDEHSLLKDGVEPKVRQRREADLPPESCQCRRADFYISWKEIGFDKWILHPTSLNIGACIGGPVVIMDKFKEKSQFSYETIMQMRKKLLMPKSDDEKKNSTTGTSLMQFKHQVENSDMGNSLSYEFLSGCQATLKSVRMIITDQTGVNRDVSLENLAVDTCTCI